MISIFCTFFSVFDIPVVSQEGEERGFNRGIDLILVSFFPVLASPGHLLAAIDRTYNEEADSVR